MRWKETGKERERDRGGRKGEKKKTARLSVSCRVMGTERERVANIIELKRWSEPFLSRWECGVKKSRRDINF